MTPYVFKLGLTQAHWSDHLGDWHARPHTRHEANLIAPYLNPIPNGSQGSNHRQELREYEANVVSQLSQFGIAGQEELKKELT